MQKKQWIVAGTVFFVLLAVAVGWQYYSKSHAPVPVFPINVADTITSWEFKGTYADNDTLIKQANADVKKLTDLLGKGQYDDYDLYIGIGNDDNFMGDGQAAYDNYNRAIALNPEKGLAFMNLGNLMDGLGAYHTAADAYGKAVLVEAGQMEFHIARLKFLTRQFPDDSALVLTAFGDASTQFGDNASVLIIEADWLTGLERYKDAIAAWERAKTISPGKDTRAMTAEIKRLRAKL